MITALVNDEWSRAEHGKHGICPECRGEVYARLPAHAVRHWAHKPLPDGQTRDCSRESGEMTEWHRAWQAQRTDLSCIEVLGEGFRADVKNAAGIVIEFQHSRIREEDIKARERYWRKGIWVADGLPDEDGNGGIQLQHLPDQEPDDPFWRFDWRPMPKLIYVATWPVWVDCGDRGLLQVNYADNGRGNGWLVTRDWFIAEVVNGTKMLLRPHPAKSIRDRRTRKAATANEFESLAEVFPVNCVRPMPMEPCCGDHPPGVLGRPVVLACKLCPKSPLYWRGAHAANRT